MDYYSLLFDSVEESDIFRAVTGHKRAKLRNGTAPTHAFKRMISSIAQGIEGIVDVWESDEPDARYELVFDPQVKKHKAVTEQFILETNTKIRVKGVENDSVISEWLHDNRDDKGFAEPSTVGRYGSYRQET